MINLISIKSALCSRGSRLRTLGRFVVDGATMAAGNNSLSVRCRIEGREGLWSLKCYFRAKPRLREIYGEAYYPEELPVCSLSGRVDYVDVVVLPWVEGKPLDSFIGRRDSDYASLSREFDILALTTLDAEYAHGDVKPDNIIVGQNNMMTLIDHDALWRPEFGVTQPAEIGTLMYRHPSRDSEYFNKHIDDYSFAVISTALAALALERETMERYIKDDGTLFDPALCVTHRDPALEVAKRIFLEYNDVAHYNIARGLHSISPAIFGLRYCLYYAVFPFKLAVMSEAQYARSTEYGWGYVRGDEWIVPPLFDRCSNIDGGVAIAKLGDKDFALPVVSDDEMRVEHQLSSIAEPPTFTVYEPPIRTAQPEPKPSKRYAKAGASDNRGKLWCDAEEMLLAIYLFDGNGIASIARQLARSESAVRARILKLKLPMPKPKRRRRRR